MNCLCNLRPPFLSLSQPVSSYFSPALIFHSPSAVAMLRKQKNIVTGSSSRVPITNLSVDTIDQPTFDSPIHHERYTRLSTHSFGTLRSLNWVALQTAGLKDNVEQLLSVGG